MKLTDTYIATTYPYDMQEPGPFHLLALSQHLEGVLPVY